MGRLPIAADSSLLHQGLDNRTPDDVYLSTLPTAKEAM